MITALEKAGLEEGRDIVRRNIAVSDAGLALDDLDKRLQPARAPGAVADEFEFEPALFRFPRDGHRDLIGAN